MSDYDDDMAGDPIAEITNKIPVIIPLFGAITIFLLAMIAVNMG